MEISLSWHGHRYICTTHSSNQDSKPQTFAFHRNQFDARATSVMVDQFDHRTLASCVFFFFFLSSYYYFHFHAILEQLLEVTNWLLHRVPRWPRLLFDRNVHLIYSTLYIRPYIHLHRRSVYLIFRKIRWNKIKQQHHFAVVVVVLSVHGPYCVTFISCA